MTREQLKAVNRIDSSWHPLKGVSYKQRRNKYTYILWYHRDPEQTIYELHNRCRGGSGNGDDDNKTNDHVPDKHPTKEAIVIWKMPKNRDQPFQLFQNPYVFFSQTSDDDEPHEMTRRDDQDPNDIGSAKEPIEIDKNVGAIDDDASASTRGGTKDNRPRRKQEDTEIVKTTIEKRRIKKLKEKYTVWPLQNITETHENDVMYDIERGGITYRHKGNKKYQALVSLSLKYINRKQLPNTSSLLLAAITEIIRIWRAQSPIGRFLNYNKKTGHWDDIGDTEARTKISQEIRKQQEEKENGSQFMGGKLAADYNALSLSPSSSSSSSSVSASSSLPLSSRSVSTSINKYTSSNKSRCNNWYANKNTKHQHWSKEEDEKLKIEVNKCFHQGGTNGNNWDRIAMSESFRGTRSVVQCKNRWANYLQPGIKNGCWTKYDDDYILKMVSEVVGFGKWAEIAKRGLPNRTPNQIRDRYINVLDPNKETAPWTTEEDRILFELQSTAGNKWAEFRQVLTGRTSNDIKNRYYNQMKGQRRRMAVNTK